MLNKSETWKSIRHEKLLAEEKITHLSRIQFQAAMADIQLIHHFYHTSFWNYASVGLAHFPTLEPGMCR